MKTAMQLMPSLRAIDTSIGVRELANINSRAEEMLANVRDAMLSPSPAKIAPTFTTTTLSALCGIDKTRLNYLIGKGELPPGEAQGVGKSRIFTLAEARQWVRAESGLPLRPEGKSGFSIVAANFKGGSTKTTTVMTLGQGLTLRGHKVLVIDLDPQGSLTALCGLLPEKDVVEEDTVIPLIYGDMPDLSYACRPTYWDGMDIVPAMASLFAAEFYIPSQVMKHEDKFRFWEIISNGIAPLRDVYDVILFDTPPALSYLSINALMAGDGMIVPLPPRTLDYASSASFWALFSDLVENFEKQGASKRFDFVSVLLSSVASDTAAPIVKDWILKTYQQLVLPVEIPSTSMAGTMSAQFGSIYDISKWDGNTKTYLRAKQAYDGFVDLINQKIIAKWYGEDGGQDVA